MNPRTGYSVDRPRKKREADIPSVKSVLDCLRKTGRFIAQARAEEEKDARMEQSR
jgi:hypothetical protein